MDAREYLNSAQDAGDIINIGLWGHLGEEHACLGHGRAIIVNRDEKIAVYLERCGDELRAGTMVKYSFNSEFNTDNQYQVSGSPANIRE